MFGYVRIFKPDLKIAEYDTYKAMYCSLCKTLGKKYGHLMRFTLSYDFTFLIVLALSLKKDCCNFKKSHCVYNPLKKCYYNSNCNDVYEFVAATAVAMVYFKAIDNINDESGFKRFRYVLVKSLLKPKVKKAVQAYPDVFNIVEALNNNQQSVENSDCSSIDSAAEPTAIALGEICKLLCNGYPADALYRVGYCVGKWVYLIDALADYDDDIKQGRFNVIKETDFDSVVGTLNICSNEAGIAFESLPFYRYDGIIKNILYLGMPNQVKNIFDKRKGVNINERPV